MKNINISIRVKIGILLLMFAAGTAGAQQLGDGLFARIKTSRGEIVVRLEYERTPLTVCNFTALAEGRMNVSKGKPFYDGLVFHRVISKANGDNQDFMIQGGDPDPLGKSRGGPGYRFPDEFVPALKHDRPGVLSMANAGPNTNGSQFFITIVPTPWLDGKHTVFGYVVQGQSVVNSIKQGDKIESVIIIRNGSAANVFKADQETFDKLLSQAEAVKKTQIRRDESINRINKAYPNAVLTNSGLRYIIQKQGTGTKPKAGAQVRVNLKGSLLSGKYFDNTDMRGGPFEFHAGTGNVFQGLDESVLDMKVGEKRLVIVPPELAYGELVIGNDVIPADSFLIFEMELVSIN
jgi:peptidylprolyl isomerase